MSFKNSFLILGLVCASSAFSKVKASFNLIESKTVSQWMNAKTPDLYVMDANNENTRKEYGTVPGAKLLSSYDKFDVASDLPQKKDSKLVFYCANEKCTASHKAAEKALENGYKNVFVMSDGIMGWKKNGFSATAL